MNLFELCLALLETICFKGLAVRRCGYGDIAAVYSQGMISAKRSDCTRGARGEARLGARGDGAE